MYTSTNTILQHIMPHKLQFNHKTAQKHTQSASHNTIPLRKATQLISNQSIYLSMYSLLRSGLHCIIFSFNLATVRAGLYRWLDANNEWFHE